MKSDYEGQRIWEMAFMAAIVGKSPSAVIGEKGIAERSATVADHALEEFQKRAKAGKFGKEEK